MRKKIFYRVLPFFSLIFAMFFSVPSFAASSLISTYGYNKVPSYSATLNYYVSLADYPEANNYNSSTGNISYSYSGDGALTIVIPVEYKTSLGSSVFSDSSGSVNDYPAAATSMLAFLAADSDYSVSFTNMYGTSSGTLKYTADVVNGGWYLSTGVDENLICPQVGSFNSANYFDLMPNYTYMAQWPVTFRGDLVITIYASNNTGGYWKVSLTPSLVLGQRSWTSSPLRFYSGDAPVTDGDIFDQTNTITNGYDNSSLTGSNSDLSGGLTQYENQENEMLGQVDFTSVAMTDVFSLSDFVSSTSLFGTFMQGIFTNLGTANAIIIISLSLMFALAALGYRKYLRG